MRSLLEPTFGPLWDPLAPLTLLGSPWASRVVQYGNGPASQTHPRPHPRPPKTTQDHTTPHNTPPNPTQDLPRPAQDHPRPRFWRPKPSQNRSKKGPKDSPRAKQRFSENHRFSYVKPIFFKVRPSQEAAQIQRKLLLEGPLQPKRSQNPSKSAQEREK